MHRFGGKFNFQCCLCGATAVDKGYVLLALVGEVRHYTSFTATSLYLGDASGVGCESLCPPWYRASGVPDVFDVGSEEDGLHLFQFFVDLLHDRVDVGYDVIAPDDGTCGEVLEGHRAIYEVAEMLHAQVGECGRGVGVVAFGKGKAPYRHLRLVGCGAYVLKVTMRRAALCCLPA